ncbi:MAG TPA: hypothetical protein VL088_13475 [Pedobacter sp.]|nr:hypothetical protein [Pedobacter sp.]
MDIYQTNDVFGVRSKLIASYVERSAVNKLFVDALTDGNEVIVYGSSKQGKTSLILKHLKPDNCVKVECSPQTQPIDIYKSILRQLDITYIESETREEDYEHGAKVKGGFKIKVPIVGEVGFGAEAADKSSHGNTKNVAYTEYNLALAQDVSELLRRNNISRYLVLENFHYLALEVQETLAYDLRVFLNCALSVFI